MACGKRRLKKEVLIDRICQTIRGAIEKISDRAPAIRLVYIVVTEMASKEQGATYVMRLEEWSELVLYW
jgi:hypothetical protein